MIPSVSVLPKYSFKHPYLAIKKVIKREPISAILMGHYLLLSIQMASFLLEPNNLGTLDEVDTVFLQKDTFSPFLKIL